MLLTRCWRCDGSCFAPALSRRSPWMRKKIVRTPVARNATPRVAAERSASAVSPPRRRCGSSSTNSPTFRARCTSRADLPKRCDRSIERAARGSARCSSCSCALMSSTTRYAMKPASARHTSTTTMSARPRRIHRVSPATAGCSSPASVAATRIQPMTRVDAASNARPAMVSPSIANASTTDRALTWSRVVCGSATAAYRTGVPKARRGRGEVMVVDLDWRSVAVFLAAFVALTALFGLVRGASRSLTWIGLGSLLALALDPLVSRLEARLGGRRRVAVSVVLAGFLVAVLALVALFGPPAARQASDLSDDLPGVVADLETLPFVGDYLAKNDVPQKVEDFLNDLPSRLAGDTTPVENAGRSLASGALAALGTILATVTLLLDGERLLGRIRRLVPEQRRDAADRIGRLAYRSIGQYFAGSVLVAAIAGVAVASVGLILGVPLAPLAGAWVAIFDLVPQIGGAAGGVPFVLLGFTHSATTGIICAVFFVLYLQFENNILSPLVVGKSVDLSPPATMTAALVGVSAGGVVGAMVAVPLLGAAKAVYLELRRGDLEEGGPVADHVAKDAGQPEPDP